ncbi:hypothetical protein EJB05_25763, partial [Eragrostis curvula]
MASPIGLPSEQNGKLGLIRGPGCQRGDALVSGQLLSTTAGATASRQHANGGGRKGRRRRKAAAFAFSAPPHTNGGTDRGKQERVPHGRELECTTNLYERK